MGETTVGSANQMARVRLLDRGVVPGRPLYPAACRQKFLVSVGGLVQLGSADSATAAGVHEGQAEQVRHLASLPSMQFTVCMSNSMQAACVGACLQALVPGSLAHTLPWPHERIHARAELALVPRSLDRSLLHL